MDTIIYCVTAIICVGMLCVKGVTITSVSANKSPDDDTRSKMKEVFEMANETDTDKDPTYKEVMEYIDEAFGGVDYGNEPAEATEE